MKKVLLIISSTEFGGGTKHINEIKSHLDKKLDIYLAAPSNCLDIPNDNYLKISQSKYTIRDIFKLNQFVKKSSVKIIHSHGRGAALITRSLKLLNFNITHIYTLHGVHTNFQSNFIYYLYIYYEAVLGSFDSTRIFVSDSEKFEYMSIWGYSRKNIVIYNGLKGVQTRTVQFEPFFDVGVLTRMHPQKNLSEFLSIAKSLPNLKFVIAGDGPEKHILEKYAQDKSLKNVTFMGYCSDVNFFFNNIKVYLSTSHWEGLPYSVLESVSFGVPPVLSKVVGHVDFKVDDIGATLYEGIDQAVGFLDAIISDKKLYLKKVEELKQLQKKFSIENFKDRLMNVYNEIDK